jgi:hypothetical protein
MNLEVFAKSTTFPSLEMKSNLLFSYILSLKQTPLNAVFFLMVVPYAYTILDRPVVSSINGKHADK